jgi:RNA polymerase sigma factor (sigma-70 family)
MSQLQLDSTVHQLRRLAGAAGPTDLTDEELLDAFRRHRDEGAFGTLVRRHAALVMGVCRRALGHHHDAEDAFQATFLVLARDSASIRRGNSLAAFLYGVAHRVALNSRRGEARRRQKERHAARSEAAPPAEELSWREVQALLDEEVQALPLRYRQVFVLCCLEGLSKPEAARQLGLKEGTVSGQLARARRRLQERLQRRGVALSSLLAVVGLAHDGAQVGAAAVRTTTALAVVYAAGACSPSVVPAPVAVLADGVTAPMLLTKTKLATALVLLVGLLAAGAGLLLAPLTAQPPTGKARPDAKPAKPIPAQVQGRVLGPDGKPVQGAKVYQVDVRRLDSGPRDGPKLLAQCDAAGKFQTRRPTVEEGRPMMWIAASAGYGPAVVEAKTALAATEITFRLVKDVPIEGRIVSLEGTPVPGVTVQPFMMGLTRKEDLGPWLQAIEQKKSPRLEDFFSQVVIAPQGIPGLPARLTTDAEGRVRLTGVGRERLIALNVSGPKIENDFFLVMTRTGKPFRMRESPNTEYEHRVYPATFQHAVSPAQPLLGTVRDSQTGNPIAGAMVDLGMGRMVGARTKKDGTYKVDSLPAMIFRAGGEGSISLLVIPPSDQPYLPAFKEVQLRRGTEPRRIDVALLRGVWADGRVTDKRSGKPVRAVVEYIAANKNPAVKKFPDFLSQHRLGLHLFHTKAGGSFRIPILPGPGAIGARVTVREYLRGGSLTEAQTGELLLPRGGTLANYHAVALIDGKADATVKCDLTVDPGEKLTCQVLDPQGKPVTGCRVLGLGPVQYWAPRPLPGAGLTLEALRPKEPRWVVVLHPGRQLAASLEVQAGDKEPVPIRLEPTGTITGRLLDPDGAVWKRQDLSIYFNKRGKDSLNAHLLEVVQTDDEGRFRVEGVVPGLIYQVNVAVKRRTIGSVKVGLTLKPGELKGLGDIKARLFRD